jgi:hypothetical protein
LEAAVNEKSFPRTQGTSLHAILGKKFHGKTVQVKWAEQGVQKSEVWTIFCEVQIYKERSLLGGVAKGDIAALGVVERRTRGCKALDVMFLNGVPKDDLAIGTNLADLLETWRGGLDYKSIEEAATKNASLDGELVALLVDGLGELSAKLYKPVKVFRRTILLAVDKEYLTELLRLQTGETLEKCRQQASRLAVRGFKIFLIGAGVLGGAVIYNETQKSADKIVACAWGLVQQAYGPRSPQLTAGSELIVLINETYGRQSVLPDSTVIAERITRALEGIHEEFLNKGSTTLTKPALENYPDNKPFVKVNEEYYFRYTEPQP